MRPLLFLFALAPVLASCYQQPDCRDDWKDGQQACKLVCPGSDGCEDGEERCVGDKELQTCTRIPCNDGGAALGGGVGDFGTRWETTKMCSGSCVFLDNRVSGDDTFCSEDQETL